MIRRFRRLRLERPTRRRAVAVAVAIGAVLASPLSHESRPSAAVDDSTDSTSQVVDSPDGREYRIDVPRVSTAAPAAVWDLMEAHLIVDASDFHVVELAVKGAVLKQPYSFSYKLLTHDVASPDGLAPDTFDIPIQPGTIVIRAGEGSPVPAADAFLAALRELSKVRQAR